MNKIKRQTNTESTSVDLNIMNSFFLYGRMEPISYSWLIESEDEFGVLLEEIDFIKAQLDEIKYCVLVTSLASLSSMDYIILSSPITLFITLDSFSLSNSCYFILQIPPNWQCRGSSSQQSLRVCNGACMVEAKWR